MKKVSPDIYKQNLALLKKNHQHVYALINKTKHPFKGEIVSASNGHQAIRLEREDGETVILYDETIDETDIRFVPEDFYGLIYLIGMGMGYTALSLVEQKPSMRFLVIFEPDVEIFSQVLHVMDLAPVLSDFRVIISIGENPDLNTIFTPARNALMTESLCYRKHLPSIALNPAYEMLVKKVFDYAPLYLISGGTISARGGLFFENRLQHFRTMHHNSLFESLRDTFAGRPAILVAAGPSLNKNVQYLKYAKGKAVIISVDSALPALIRNGVTPDFVTTMDAFNFSYEKIADQASFAKGISLIAAPTANVKAPKIFPADHVFWTFTENETDKWLNSILGGKATIEGAETVAHLNLFSALMMGCSPIVFVGQDLAYTNSESHAAHTVLSGRNVMKDDLKSSNKVVWVKGVEGKNIPTSLAYYNMKRFFEEIIRIYQRPYINATEGGAHIEGTEIISLKQVIQQNCVNFIDVSGKVKAAVTESPKRDMDDLQQDLSNEIGKISRMAHVLDDTLKLTAVILNDLEHLKLKRESHTWDRIEDLPKHVIQNMKKSDALNNQLDQSLDIWRKLTEITIECLKYSERMRHEMSLLEREKGRFLAWLIKREERLTYINQYRKGVLEKYKSLLDQIMDTYDMEKKAMQLSDEKPGSANNHLLNLALHYFNHKDLMLAKPIFQELGRNEIMAKDALFYLGCIALNHAEYEDARHYFEQAKTMDSRIEEREKAYSIQLGNEYVEYSKQPNYDKAASRRLLVKGLRYCPWHGEIIQSIRQQFDEDFDDIEARIRNSPDDVIAIIESWLEDFTSYRELKNCLDKGRIGELYALYGRILAMKEKFEDAERKFSKALEHTAENPYFHALIADAYFAQDKYNLGVMHLNKAVDLDRSYANCWEDIGNSLYDQGQYTDALSAFEMCFKSLPENKTSLKKIGDCYQKLGKLEAAEEAYRQYDRLTDDSSAIIPKT